MPRQPFQHPHMVRRQAADAEHHQALRQPVDGFSTVQLRQQVVEQAGAVGMAVGGELAPEQGLPCLVRAEIQQLAALPGGQPVVTVEQVLVEDVGDARGQGQPAALVATLQVLRQARRALKVRRLAEPVVEAPAEGDRVEGRLRRQLAEHQAGDVPDETRRQLDIQVHGDALLARQLQGQPAPHALARHHHPGGRQWVALGLREQAAGQLAEAFQVVGVVEVEHGGHRIRKVGTG
ncbi:hypothetical protein D9M68_538900 [compost metagenome]